MKATLALLCGTLLLAGAAQARTHREEIPPTVDEMTCVEAQAYATKNNRYYVKGADGQRVPIYPIVTDYTSLRCVVREYGSPIFERTGDGAVCVLSWKCRS